MSDPQLQLPAPPPLALIIPGLHGSGPAHWQTIWETTRFDCVRVRQRDWHDPDPDEWVATLHRAIRRTARPVLLVAHSLGCLLVARWAETFRAEDQVRGALLVAPCDPERPGAPDGVARFAPPASSAFPFASTLVASRDDPYASFERARCFAESWGSALVDVGHAGHINAHSNLGEWRFGQVLLEDLAGRTAASAAVERHRRAGRIRERANDQHGPPCQGVWP